MKKPFLLFAIAIAIYGCNKDQVIPVGAIEGQIKMDPAIEDEIVNYTPYFTAVWLDGTGIMAYSDSSGKYKLVNVPEGEYTIKAQDLVYGLYNTFLCEGKQSNVKVEGGETKEVSTITMFEVESSGSNEPYVSNLKLNDGFSDNYFYSSEVLIYSNEVKITGYVRDYMGVGYIDTIVSFQLNDQRVQQMTTSKGYFVQNLTLSEGLNIIKVWIGDDEVNARVDIGKFVYLTNIQEFHIELYWSTDYDYSAGDFDIHLINNEDNDSCWYDNPNPDWGVEDMEIDNPHLYDEINSYGFYSESENLSVSSIAEGQYILRVHYFSNRENPNHLVQPEITYNLNSDYYTASAPNAMHVGDYWTVATIIVSAKKSEIKFVNKIEKSFVTDIPNKK